MSRSSMSRLAPLVALAGALAGCTLLDGRDAVSIDGPGPLLGSDTVEVTVRTKAKVAKAELLVDGRVLTEVAVNRAVQVDVSSVSPGRRALVARVYQGPQPAESGPMVLEIDRTAPVVTFELPTGALPTLHGISVRLAFSHPIRPSDWSPENIGLGLVNQLLPATVVLEADRQHASVSTEQALPGYSGLRLVVTMRDAHGNLAVSQPAGWLLPASPLGVFPLGAELADLGGRVAVRLSPGWSGPAGPVALAVFSPNLAVSWLDLAGPSELVEIDTSAWSDGVGYVVAFLAGFGPSPAIGVVKRHLVSIVGFTPSRNPTNGPVELGVRLDGDIADSLEVLVGGALLATLPTTRGHGAFTATVNWPAAVPDGSYPVTARIPGHVVTPFTPTTVVVDRTPPRPTAVTPALYDRIGGSPLLMLGFTEAIQGPFDLLLDGVVVGSRQASGTLEASYLDYQPTPGALAYGSSLTFDVSRLTDQAGNHVVGTPPALPIPWWIADAVGASPKAAEAVALPRIFGSGVGFDLGYIPPSGQVNAGQVMVANGEAGGPLVTWAPPLTGPGTVATGLTGFIDPPSMGLSIAGETLGWAERIGSGAGHVGAWNRALANADLAADAGPPVLLHPPSSGLWMEAWSEATVAGGRALQVRIDPESPVALQPASYTGVADSPALGCCVADASGAWPVLAWLDRSGSKAQVMATILASPWLDLGGLGTDPTVAADPPTTLKDLVAWTEGGTLRSAVVALPPGSVVRDDPTADFPARWPRFLPWSVEAGPPVLVFVEATPQGDRIAARRHVPGQGWVTIPPAKEADGVTVAGFQVAGSVITWLDPDGGIHLVRLN